MSYARPFPTAQVTATDQKKPPAVVTKAGRVRKPTSKVMEASQQATQPRAKVIGASGKRPSKMLSLNNPAIVKKAKTAVVKLGEDGFPVDDEEN